MGLPHELLPFAENLYRRFPEEFMALGMPGLEQAFDLRADGSRSRRISETPTEKTIEITIRRWQPPSSMNSVHPGHAALQPHAPHLAPAPYLVQAGYAAAWPLAPNAWGAPQALGPPPGMPRGFGPPWSHGAAGYSSVLHPQAPQPDVATAASPAESQMTSQLARLEAVLSTLKPQIEAQAAMLSQAHTSASAQKLSPSPSKRSVPLLGGSAQPGGNSPASYDRQVPASPLRDRRNIKDIRIEPPIKAAPSVIPDGVAGKPDSPTVVEPEAKPAQAAPAVISTNQVDTKDRKRPQKVATGRMAPTAGDPESPRSPGRYSAWK